MYKFLIVEDDTTIAEQLANYMEKWGYQAKTVTDFSNVTKEFTDYEPHLVLLDITLPFFNGFYWCGQIRKLSKVPIMFISSASDNMNIVMAMNMGADDFVAKPFDLSVLTAKVQALLRRAYDFGTNTSVLEHNGVLLNLNDTTVLFESKQVELTRNEFKILQILMEHGGCVVSREQLMTHLWDSDCFVDDNTLTVNITRLRRKLEDLGVENYIITKKGMGYLV